MKNLLWIDCTAGALAGLALLLLEPWLSALYTVPNELLRLMAVVNLLYATYSFSLAVRGRRRRGLLYALIVANGVWACICLGIAVAYAGTASAFGIAHLLGEAVFVGGLALLEWTWRERLLMAADASAPITGTAR